MSPARKKSRSKSVIRKIAKPTAVRIVVEPPSDLPFHYANHIEVSHSKNEFALSIARIPTKFGSVRLKEIRDKGVLEVEPDLQIVIPITIIRGLIRALGIQLGLYETNFGKIEKRGEDNE